MQMIGLLGMLSICSIEDILKKQIRVFYVLLAGIAGVVMHLYKGEQSIWSILAGVGIGLFLLLVSFLSDESVGKGDSLMVIVCGVYLGFWDNLFLLWGASALAACTGIIITYKLKKGKKYEIPFAPFLLLGYLIMIILRGGVSVAT